MHTKTRCREERDAKSLKWWNGKTKTELRVAAPLLPSGKHRGLAGADQSLLQEIYGGKRHDRERTSQPLTRIQ
jgi:hypothetical protein